MANYYMDMSHGNVGKGMPHAQYILGQGKYDYKDKEVQYVSNNLPSWAKDESDFWNEADYNERVNGRVYTELKVSLPNNLNLEENIRLLDDFVEKTLGNNHYYTVAIHDKESSYEGIQNIHAHIMFSERKLDGIKRDRETFFKRANTVNPEKGGTKKDRSWITKNKLLVLRKSWEVLQNDYLKKNNINEQVSCETLEKQREEALKQGDKLKAELLDREPININGQILMKRKRTPREEIELEQFKLKREIKNLKEEVYILELKELGKQKIKGLESEIVNLKEENINLPFSDILNMKSNVEMYNFEIEKSLNDIQNIRTLAIKELYPALSIAELELNNSIDNKSELLKIEGLQNRVEIELLKVDKNLLEDKTIQVKKELEELIKMLEIQRANELKNYENHGRLIIEKDIKGYVDKQIFETNKENYSKYIKEEIKFKNLKNTFKKTSTLEKKENIEKTTLNILTGYKHSKLENEIANIMSKRGKLGFKIRNKGSYNGIKGDGSKESNKWIKEYDMLFEKILKKENESKIIMDKLKTPEMKNKKIRIEKSIEKKLNFQKENNLFEQFKTKNNIEILKSKLEIIIDKNEVLNSNVSKLEKENDILNKSIDLIKSKIEQNSDDEKFEREAYNNLTKGKTLEISNLYQNLKKENLEMRKELEQVSGFNLFKKQKIANGINKIIKEMKDLENEDFKLKKSISTEALYDEIINLKEKSKNEFNENEGKELESNLNSLKNNLKENIEEIRLNKNLLKKPKPKLERNINLLKPHTPTFKSFKEKNVSQGRSNLKIWSNEQENDMEIDF